MNYGDTPQSEPGATRLLLRGRSAWASCACRIASTATRTTTSTTPPRPDPAVGGLPRPVGAGPDIRALVAGLAVLVLGAVLMLDALGTLT